MTKSFAQILRESGLDNQYISAAEAAKRLNLSREQIFYHIHHGTIKAIRIGQAWAIEAN